MIKIPKILAIDPGSNKTGWALGHSKLELSGVMTFKPKSKEKKDLGERLNGIADWIADMLDEHKPDYVVFEAANPGLKGTARYLITSIDSIIRMTAHLHEKKVITASPSELKKFIAGSGKASKKNMVDSIQFLGYHPVDDNEADAIGLYLLALDGLQNQNIQRKERK